MKPDDILAYFHPAGWPFIAAFAVITLVLAFCSGPFFVIGLILTGWCAYFFRDPSRVTPTNPGFIVSPADGRVVGVRDLVPDSDLELGTETRTRISIFLNVFDVHVNRMPADGVVTDRQYRVGKFFNAALDKASVDNERMTIILQLTGDHPYKGQTVGVVQIAGLIARRIICDAKKNDTFHAGERYGIIRFGSRADVYLPPGVKPLVLVGQFMIGGETILADCASNAGVRTGEQS
jgi:phosphatidylserine decarboxylase